MNATTDTELPVLFEVNETDWIYYFDYQNIQYYAERDVHKPNLVITIGDSWSWGDSLNNGKIKPGNDDVNYRMSYVYGGVLADKLDAGFINMSFPGCGNYWMSGMFDVCYRNIHNVSKNYEQVYIIVTFTEIGRLLEFENYREKLSIDILESYNSVLEKIEAFDFKQINDFAANLPNNVEVITGRNFTDTFDNNIKHLNNTTYLDKTWLELLFEKQGFPYNKPCRIMSGIGYDPLLELYKSHNMADSNFRSWFLPNIVNVGLERLDLLDKSILNNNVATKHPTEEGHAIWTDYILNDIKNRTYE